MEKKIALTESQLRRIIGESVRRAILESNDDGIDIDAKKNKTAQAMDIINDDAIDNAEIARILQDVGVFPRKWSNDTARSYLSKQKRGERPFNNGEAAAIVSATDNL
jgi:hypothetical protein